MGKSILYVFIAFYFWIGALWQGYIHETAYLISNLFLFAGLIIMLGWKRELTVTVPHLLILLFVAGYWIAVPYAVDAEQAVLEASRVSSLIPLSLLIMNIPSDRLIRLYRVWPWIGAVITFIGVVFGMERNGRLESTIEYANALAIFLLINIGVCLFSYMQERRMTYVVLMIVNAVGLLLTFSRSVWVLWLVMVCAAMFLFAEMRRRSVWLTIGMVHLCSMGIALLIKGDAFFFWQRVASIQSNTSEFQIRLVYWKDSLAMIQDYWWGGSGGGGWNVLLHLYQSQDYFVKFIHNHFVQIALDIGLFGLLVFIVWLGYFYKAGMKRIRSSKGEAVIWLKGTLMMVTVMSLHAGFDFDLTFPFLFGVLICLTIPMSEKKYTLRVPGRLLGVIVPAMTAIVFFWGWLATGYGYSQTGNYHVRAGQYALAQETFMKAEKLLPWSSSVLYNSAKGYVQEGNTTGDVAYYKLAADQLRQAHKRVPDQTLYKDLLNQLPNSDKK